MLPLEYLKQARAFTLKHNLQLHLDGARVYNAAVALNVDVKDIAQYFDSMTVCLSKGLAAPVGSLLLGSNDFIKRARRIRKMLGGGMRQAGILAAAGKIALTDQVTQLKTDHKNAQILAKGLNALSAFELKPELIHTNIVFAKISDHIDRKALQQYLQQQGIIIGNSQPMRFVLHKDINQQDVEKFLQEISLFTN